MQTPRICQDPRFAAYVVSTGLLVEEPFCLVDVGASGGIDQYWNVFGDHLVADGFEPLVAETVRLNAASPSSRIHYHATRVVGPRRLYDRVARLSRETRWARARSPWDRLSAVLANRLLQQDYAVAVYDPSGHGALADSETTLDDWYQQAGRGSVDFLKVDTDGTDYLVLRGAEHMLRDAPVLGVACEVNFHGPLHPHGESFATVDRFLRSVGFSLVDLEPQRYSRAALPQPFAISAPAQTVRGQVIWGDALYLRDVGDPAYAARWRLAFTPQKVLKLACLYEIFGCEDCAAEVLSTCAVMLEKLRPRFDLGTGLDRLTPQHNGTRSSYWEYLMGFLADPTQWYPAAQESGASSCDAPSED